MKLIAPAIILSSLGAAKFWVSALPSPIDGYQISIPEWEVEVSPGGPFVKLNGTVQEIHRELLKLNPDWDTHYPLNTTEESPSLNKRAFELDGYFCGGRWPPCRVDAIKEGVAYLRRIRGLPTMHAGPSFCDRVSCSYAAAIYWCNDARVQKTLLGGFGDLAGGAEVILDNCQMPGEFPMLSGQAFSTSQYNVIVRDDPNHC